MQRPNHPFSRSLEPAEELVGLSNLPAFLPGLQTPLKALMPSHLLPYPPGHLAASKSHRILIRLFSVVFPVSLWPPGQGLPEGTDHCGSLRSPYGPAPSALQMAVCSVWWNQCATVEGVRRLRKLLITREFLNLKKKELKSYNNVYPL